MERNFKIEVFNNGDVVDVEFVNICKYRDGVYLISVSIKPDSNFNYENDFCLVNGNDNNNKEFLDYNYYSDSDKYTTVKISWDKNDDHFDISFCGEKNGCYEEFLIFYDINDMPDVCYFKKE